MLSLSFELATIDLDCIEEEEFSTSSLDSALELDLEGGICESLCLSSFPPEAHILAILFRLMSFIERDNESLINKARCMFSLNTEAETSVIESIGMVIFISTKVSGAGVGAGVGYGVGSNVGYGVGLAVGYSVGAVVGRPVGLEVGILVGYAVGNCVGEYVGWFVGTMVGRGVGSSSSGT